MNPINLPNSITESSETSRFNLNELSHGDNRIIGGSLPRWVELGHNLEGLFFIRTQVDRSQIAGSVLTGCVFQDSHFREAEFHGVTFKYCQFKKVRFDELSLHNVSFENCVFETSTLQPLMVPSETDNVTFRRCYFHDPEEKLVPFMKEKGWNFDGCVVAAPNIQESEDNLFLPLLAFIPPTIPQSGPVPSEHASALTFPSNRSEPGKPPVEKKPTSAASRFDQLELG